MRPFSVVLLLLIKKRNPRSRSQLIFTVRARSHTYPNFIYGKKKVLSLCSILFSPLGRTQSLAPQFLVHVKILHGPSEKWSTLKFTRITRAHKNVIRTLPCECRIFIRQNWKHLYCRSDEGIGLNKKQQQQRPAKNIKSHLRRRVHRSQSVVEKNQPKSRSRRTSDRDGSTCERRRRHSQLMRRDHLHHQDQNVNNCMCFCFSFGFVFGHMQFEIGFGRTPHTDNFRLFCLLFWAIVGQPIELQT